MDDNRFDYPLAVEGAGEETGQAGDAQASVISVEQLQHLVQLLDQSDVSELELEQAAEGVHLVLRKVKGPQDSPTPGGMQSMNALTTQQVPATTPEPSKNEHKVVAPLVGTFHVWAKPKGGALVAVGDRIKAGQLVGTIQSLNVLNEVESSVAGRVVEMLVHDGQPVEYGQPLMVIDSAEETKRA